MPTGASSVTCSARPADGVLRPASLVVGWSTPSLPGPHWLPVALRARSLRPVGCDLAPGGDGEAARRPGPRPAGSWSRAGGPSGAEGAAVLADALGPPAAELDLPQRSDGLVV